MAWWALGLALEDELRKCSLRLGSMSLSLTLRAHKRNHHRFDIQEAFQTGDLISMKFPRTSDLIHLYSKRASQSMPLALCLLLASVRCSVLGSAAPFGSKYFPYRVVVACARSCKNLLASESSGSQCHDCSNYRLMIYRDGLSHSLIFLTWYNLLSHALSEVPLEAALIKHL